MDGADTKSGDAQPPGQQLHTPAATPEPDCDAAPCPHRSVQAKSDAPLHNITNVLISELNGSLAVSSTSRAASVSEEAMLSDTSERLRPIKRPGDGRRRGSSVSEHDKLLKLSSRQIQELTSEPASVLLRTATPILEEALGGEVRAEHADGRAGTKILGLALDGPIELNVARSRERRRKNSRSRERRQERDVVVIKASSADAGRGRPALYQRSVTTPAIRGNDPDSTLRTHTQTYDAEDKRPSRHAPLPLNIDEKTVPSKSLPYNKQREARHVREATSPSHMNLPLPPMSMPTFLSLELSADRPSPLYIYRASSADFPYESSTLKYERLLNFMKIPAQVEGILAFGALACLDAWMHVLTILPLRFLLATAILVKWWGSVVVKEFRDLLAFVYSGLPRFWRRRNQVDTPTPLPTPVEEQQPLISQKTTTSVIWSASQAPSMSRQNGEAPTIFQFPDSKELRAKRPRNPRFRHRRTKSTPSALLPSHKADILKGLLIISSCFVLMRFDASRMYHGIRGQSAIKLYVLYNLLEVCDRLLSAVGQDVLECLFSRETLDRNADGRSKVIRPFWMFILALLYTVAHATALFYQVITLNVAVNSYSNALSTLLMSNQFVEIKSTVFKKFEKENLFQITCADVVERFQLWLMLLIIAMRNVVEVGGLSIRSSDYSWTTMFTGASNATTNFTASNIIPMSFTIFPKYIAQVLNPFLLVLGSEMVVDWLKHAYITKFNQMKPEVYGKFFDVLAKDYYSNAFSDPNLTRRLGLPVIPLSCLFIRATIQTYHMFIAMYMPAPLPATSVSLTSAPTSSPATTAALAHIDHVFRRALGRSPFGAGLVGQQPWYHLSSWTIDDVIAASTMLLVFLVVYLIFLAFKLILGMLLLTVARNRYQGMEAREKMDIDTGGKRIGGWGVVDVDEEKRRWIYNDDAEGLRKLRERDEKTKKKEDAEREKGTGFGHVSRYAMVAKRIW